MKKFFMLCVAVLAAVNVFSQSQHLSFKGVPIDGTLKSYTQKMVEKGFVYKGTQDGVTILSGDFAGYKNCMVAVSTLKGNDLVNMIAVLFTPYDTWSAVNNEYENLKDMLTEKYGTPDMKEEVFTSYVGESDDLKMLNIKSGEYKWFTTFSTPNGDIELSIVNAEYTRARVMLRYFDKQNSEKVRQAAIDDL
ncbi:MAG: hypothetical protein MJZ57_09180 [Bacteroidales bacterium]|nr:hypothetical protein [Bacteroidales bacterium]